MVFLIGLLVSGCVGRSQYPVVVKHFSMEYPYPRFEKMAPIEAAIRVDRFTVARPDHGKKIVCRTKHYLREVYNYHRWESRHVDMITDRLLWDMKHAEVFITPATKYSNA